MDFAASAVPPVPDGGGISLGLQVTLGKVADATERMCRMLDQAAAVKAILPVPIPVVGQGVVPNPAATFTIDLGGPTQGRQWTVRRWSVADGADITNTIAGTDRADLYLGRPYGTGGGSGGIQQWLDTINNPPGLQHISNGEIIIFPPDRLFVICTGMTTVGQQIAACAFIYDEPQASSTPVFDV
jgi:hypothetical protein